MTPHDPTVPTDVQVPVVATPAQPDKPETGRDALIKKYEALYTPPDTPTEPVIETPVTEPVTVVDPMAAVMAELQALRAQITTYKTPETPVAEPVTQEDWLKLLADGKKTEGELALAKVLGPQIQQQAVQQALALMQAEREVTEFSTQIRAANADVLPMESYIAQAAQARIHAAQTAGVIKSPADYVTVYKQAVTAEIENARKLVQTFRGAGKNEAITRQAEVIASPTIRPNAVNMERDAPTKPGELPVEDASSYFAKRKALEAKGRGLSITA